MNFRYNVLEIEIELGASISAIVIENTSWYSQCVIKLLEQRDSLSESFSLIDNENELHFLKNVEVIVSPGDLHFTKSTIKKKLYQDLADDISGSELELRLLNSVSEIVEAIEAACILSDYPITYNESIGTEDVFGLMNLMLETPSGTFAEMLMEYIVVLHRLLSKSVFVVANCCTYLTYDELEVLEKFTEQEEIKIILVTNSQLRDSIPQVTVDEDLCVI